MNNQYLCFVKFSDGKWYNNHFSCFEELVEYLEGIDEEIWEHKVLFKQFFDTLQIEDKIYIPYGLSEINYICVNRI